MAALLQTDATAAMASKGRQKGEKYCHATTAGCGLDEPDLRANFFEQWRRLIPHAGKRNADLRSQVRHHVRIYRRRISFALVPGGTEAFDEHCREKRVWGPETGLGQLVRTKQPVHISDVRADRAYIDREPNRVVAVEGSGMRTVVCVPMLKER